jgi:hypothetical protein
MTAESFLVREGGREGDSLGLCAFLFRERNMQNLPGSLKSETFLKLSFRDF